jgi:hypothetical protein
MYGKGNFWYKNVSCTHTGLNMLVGPVQEILTKEGSIKIIVRTFCM